MEFKEDLTSIPIEDLNVYRVIFVDNGFLSKDRLSRSSTLHLLA